MTFKESILSIKEKEKEKEKVYKRNSHKSCFSCLNYRESTGYCSFHHRYTTEDDECLNYSSLY